MKYRYTKYTGSLLDDIDIDDLVSKLSDLLLSSGFSNPWGGPSDEEDQREAAELLHALGTAEAMRRLGTRPRHTFARALLRDTRWDTAEAGPVPILSQPSPVATARELVGLRLRRAAAS